MAHPLAHETNASQQAKLRSMTSGYGEADKKDMQYAGVNKYKQEGPEPEIGFGADDSRPNQHAARRVRKPAGGNAFATYKRGGRVKHNRAAGGDVSDIEQADIDQKLEGHKRGGRVKHRADGGTADDQATPIQSSQQNQAQTVDTAERNKVLSGVRPTGNVTKDQYGQYHGFKRGGRSERARGGQVGHHGEGKVKMGAKYATVSSEPSPTPVDNRARGGRTGKKSKKGGNHVNIMIAPQGHGAPGAAGMPPISALPTPPMAPPKPPMAGPPPGGMPPPGLPPGAGAAPGGGGLPILPPGAAPPGVMPPGLAPRPPMMPPRKHGGRVMAKKHHHDDAAADAKQIKSMVKESALKPHGSMRAAGGRMTHLTAGAYSGEGRLEKAHQNRRIAPQKV